MAVDTRAKRFSMMNFVSRPLSVCSPLFEADGSVDADDRAQLLGLYGGLADVGGGPTYVYSHLRRLRRYRLGPLRSG